jgi:signal transduction histidine kinase
MFVFVFASSIIIAFGERNHRSSERIRITREELEAQVSQRTIELNIANQQLRELTSHVLHLQDEERRRIARELHDSAGQSLVVLAMNLTRVETEAKAQMASLTKTLATVADSAVLVNELSMGIRTISYLLHPPMLDEAGLGPAMRWYIQGFAERSKIVVDLDLSDDFGRLSQDLETTIFRVVQECLANILRHSESRVAKVRIERSAEEVRIEVRDKGKGIAPEKLSEIAVSHTLGVGIRGMQERVRQLGGTLKITSDGANKGTLVVALFPLATPTSVMQGAPGRPCGEKLPAIEGLLLPAQNGAQQEGSD